MKRVVAFTLLISILVSCSILHIEKRRYRKGFHLSWNHNKIKKEDVRTIDYEDNHSINKIDNTKISAQSKVDSKSWREEAQSFVQQSLPEDEVGLTEESTIEQETNTSENSGAAINFKPEVNSKYEEVQNDSTSTKRRTNALFYFFLLGVVPVITLQRKHGYRLSKWASNNKFKSQSILGICMTTAVASSYGLGNILQWETTELMLLAPASLIASSVLIHKSGLSVGSRPTKNRFTFSLLNVGTTFGSFYAGANTPAVIRNIREPDDPLLLDPSAGIPIAIILALVLVGVLYLIAVVSCTIACNGFEIAAVLFLLGASYLAVFLASLGFLNLFRRESEKDESFLGKAALYGLLSIIGIGIFLLIVGSA